MDEKSLTCTTGGHLVSGSRVPSVIGEVHPPQTTTLQNTNGSPVLTSLRKVTHKERFEPLAYNNRITVQGYLETMDTVTL